MNRPFRLRSVFVGVTAEAKLDAGRSDQLHVGGYLAGPDFVAARTARRNRRVHSLTCCLLCMALDALGISSIFIQRNRMFLG
jgi:hypothetical protein